LVGKFLFQFFSFSIFKFAGAKKISLQKESRIKNKLLTTKKKKKARYG
jgi:hypothetical protein